MDIDDINVTAVPTPYGPVQLAWRRLPGRGRLTILFPEAMPDDLAAVWREKLAGIARTLGGRPIDVDD